MFGKCLLILRRGQTHGAQNPRNIPFFSHKKSKVAFHIVLYCLVEGKETRSFSDKERSGQTQTSERSREHTKQDRPRDGKCEILHRRA